MYIHCVWEIFQKILQTIKWTGLDGYMYGFPVDYDCLIVWYSWYLRICNKKA